LGSHKAQDQRKHGETIMIAENQYGTADIQNELLDLMKIFHAFCVENKIKYSLFGGSGLGAVRHDGFIPWAAFLKISYPTVRYYFALKCCFCLFCREC